MKVSCALQFTPILWTAGRGAHTLIPAIQELGCAPPLDRLRDNESMIRKLPSGEFRLYSRKKDPKTGRRRNLGTFKTREAAEKHERAVQFFKRH